MTKKIFRKRAFYVKIMSLAAENKNRELAGASREASYTKLDDDPYIRFKTTSYEE